MNARTVLAATLVAGALLMPAPHALAAGAGRCGPGLTTERGTCAAPVPQRPLTAAQRRQAAAKGRTMTGPRAGRATVRNYAMPEVARMTIYKEGQGDGKRSYTCGPAATRNMVAAMYKHRRGHYRDFGEHRFAVWEGTTRNGTARANIAAALNNHFSAFGHWKTWRPRNRASLLGTVAADTYRYHQSVILNVDTEYYSFFRGKALNHFDFAYGYDNRNSRHRFVYVGEEWNPIFIYGSSSYGNPYGKHKEPLAHVFTAISHTSIHGIVA